jgi:hypothetical protein
VACSSSSGAGSSWFHRRTPALALVGHAAVAAGAVVLAVLLALDPPVPPVSPWLTTLAGAQTFVGLGALGTAQGLAIHRWVAHREALAAGVRRLEWTMALALYPIVVGMGALLADPPPAPLLAVHCVLPPASLLLDLAYAGWAHRRLDGRGPRALLLPPGDGYRLRRKLRGSAPLLIGLAVVALLCAVSGPSGGPPAIGALAALATAVPALLLVGPVRRVRGAVHGDTVDLPELDSGLRAMRRIGPCGALGAALLATAVLVGSAGPALAVFLAVPLALTQGVLSAQVGLALRVRLGVPLSPAAGRPSSPRRRSPA